VLSASLTRLSPVVIEYLLLGCCGKFERSTVADAAFLLYAMLSKSPVNEVEQQFVTTLNQEVFKLGEPAHQLVLQILGKSAQGQLNSSQLYLFLEDVWDIHQAEDTDALPNSDLVAYFLRKYNKQDQIN
jgi:hypothetical protein